MTDRLESWGWSDRVREAFAPWEDGLHRAGRVVTQERTRWTIETVDGTRTARLLGDGDPAARPVVGDWVVVLPGPTAADPLTIAAILPRATAFQRQAAGVRTEPQVIAANVDTVWIVHGLDAPVNSRRLERYLALTWESGAQPAFVLTKADIATDLMAARREVDAISFGTPVWIVSRDDTSSIEALGSSLIPGATVALLGPSGVGKSSLINRLAGAGILETGEVRETDRKGRHTTTRRHLVRLGSGALLLDTPGMRELQVWHLEDGLVNAFPEIGELASRCRFRDCSHDSEPDCAVLHAVATGELDPQRLASFRKLQAEAEYQRRRRDPIARAEALSDLKAAMKSLKQHHPKYRSHRSGSVEPDTEGG